MGIWAWLHRTGIEGARHARMKEQHRLASELGRIVVLRVIRDGIDPNVAAAGAIDQITAAIRAELADSREREFVGQFK